MVVAIHRVIAASARSSKCRAASSQISSGFFGVPFEGIAPIVGRSDEAARKLASRARRRVRMQDVDQATDTLRQARLVEAFLAAARNREFEQLLAVLAVAWMPDGELRVVFKFTAAGARITAIDLIADPDGLRQLDLIAPFK